LDEIYGMLKDTLRLMMFLLSSILCVQAQTTQAETPYSEEELLGQFDAASHSDFAVIPGAYTKKTEIYLRKAVLTAFESMWKAAKSDGLHLEIISATRSFSAQRSIWNRKWNAPRFMGFQAADRAREILRYSSMPGTSRHHWGTDIDLNSLENEWFETPPGSHIYAWLNSNAAEFGFHQVYTNKSKGRTGYEEERWHWSYLPLAETMWEQYCGNFNDSMMRGFEGSEWADTLLIMQNYVQGIEAHSVTKRQLE
jgi:zinc D-Ala-D-Ala carboxypeptidase